MDLDALMIAQNRPADWASAYERLRIVKDYERIDRPSTADADTAAEKLGLTRSSFYRLVQAVRAMREDVSAKRGRGARRPRLEPRAAALVVEVMQELGEEATDAAVQKEVVRRCHAEGVVPPALTSIRLRRSNGSTSIDLARRLARTCDYVLDDVALNLDVSCGSEVRPAHLLMLFHASSGDERSCRLSFGPASGATLVRTIIEGVGRRSCDASSGPQVLVATGRCADLLVPFKRRLSTVGILVDQAGSKGLRPGSATTAKLGRRLGTVAILPRRVEAHSRSASIPLPLARRIVRALLEPKREGSPEEV